MIHEKPVEIVYEKLHTPEDVSTCIRGRNIVEAQVHAIGGIAEMTMLKGIAEIKKYFPNGKDVPETIKAM